MARRSSNRASRRSPSNPGNPHSPALALSLVSDIVRAHGGRVTLDSRTEVEEHYTCVTLVLPSVGASVAAE